MSMQVNDFIDGYVGYKVHMLTNQKTPVANYKDPKPTLLFNPLGLHRRMDRTPNDVPAVNLTKAVDPALNIGKEGFETSVQLDSTDELLQETYLQSLTERAKAVTNFCLAQGAYHPWTSNWKLLNTNLKNKNKFNFKVLDASDQDIAYVIDKGVKVCFRIHDKKRFMPINIYQYVLYHEMAHMSTTEHGHTKFFHELLNLLSLAAYELGFIDLQKVTKSVYTTNGQGIASAESLQDEIISGCNHMIKQHASNPKLKKYYEDLRTHVARRV